MYFRYFSLCFVFRYKSSGGYSLVAVTKVCYSWVSIDSLVTILMHVSFFKYIFINDGMVSDAKKLDM